MKNKISKLSTSFFHRINRKQVSRKEKTSLFAGRVKLLFLFLFMGMLAQGQKNYYHQDEHGLVRINFIDKKDGFMQLFVAIENNEKKPSTLRLVSENVVLYESSFKEKTVLKTFKIEDLVNRINVVIKRKGDIPRVFQIIVSTKISDDVRISTGETKITRPALMQVQW